MTEFYNYSENPRPIPVINNMPLDDYFRLKRQYDEYEKLVGEYEFFIKNVFGRTAFINDVDPYSCKKIVKEDTVTNKVEFIFSFEIFKDKADMILKRNEWINNEKESH